MKKMLFLGLALSFNASAYTYISGTLANADHSSDVYQVACVGDGTTNKPDYLIAVVNDDQAHNVTAGISATMTKGVFSSNAYDASDEGSYSSQGQNSLQAGSGFYTLLVSKTPPGGTARPLGIEGYTVQLNCYDSINNVFSDPATYQLQDQ